MLKLEQTTKSDKRLVERMKNHYSQPKGFVGRSICYAVFFDDVYYGHIVAGSSTLHLPGRDEFLGIDKSMLNYIVNNIFYNVSPAFGSYPIRNFTTRVLKLFTETVLVDWQQKYGDECIGFETLVEKPRTGELYLRAGWTIVGETKGLTCKRVGGIGSDSWGGRRVWNNNPNELRPKTVLCYKPVTIGANVGNF